MEEEKKLGKKNEVVGLEELKETGNIVQEIEGELPHIDVMAKIDKQIQELLKDPFLCDLQSGISLEEVQSQLALEQGRAMTIKIRRFDNEVIPVVVLQGATVNDLIKAFEREVLRRCKRSGKTTYISWRYVWRTYWLVYNHQKLSNRGAKLASYGISNNEELNFLKRLKREDRPGRLLKGQRTAQKYSQRNST